MSSAQDAVDLSLLVIRVGLGIVFLAHGYNHVFGGGKIAGTAGWFESLGMKPGILHAWLASLTELAAGVSLIFGFLTPLGCAGIIGTMLVALVTNHLKNGFFIFRPGEGYEYVLTLILMAVGLSGLGAGEWSLDNAFGFWDDPVPGWWGLLFSAIGAVGAVGLLVTFWRPAPKPAA